VEVHEGLVKHDLATHTAEITGDSPVAPRPKPAYSAVLCEIIANEKSLAVQAALLADPRKAKEVAVVLMLAENDSYDHPLDLTPHRCLHTGADAPEPSKGYTALEEHAHPLAAQVVPEAAGEDQPFWRRLLKTRRDAASLYGAIKALSDADLDALHLLLPVLCMGQGHCDRLDTEDSFFNQIACDLDMDMRQWWRPEASYLQRRTKAQLIEIATDSGAAETLGPVSKCTKAELVTSLSAYFAGNTDAARGWLPGVMQFPAVEHEGANTDTVAETDAAAA
jgi:ParB family chromosome partitioning protein